MAKDKARKASEATANIIVPIDSCMMTRLEDGPVTITIKLMLQWVTYKGQRRIGVHTSRPKMSRVPKPASGDAA